MRNNWCVSQCTFNSLKYKENKWNLGLQRAFQLSTCSLKTCIPHIGCDHFWPGLVPPPPPHLPFLRVCEYLLPCKRMTTLSKANGTTKCDHIKKIFALVKFQWVVVAQVRYKISSWLKEVCKIKAQHENLVSPLVYITTSQRERFKDRMWTQPMCSS